MPKICSYQIRHLVFYKWPCSRSPAIVFKFYHACTQFNKHWCILAKICLASQFRVSEDSKATTCQFKRHQIWLKMGREKIILMYYTYIIIVRLLNAWHPFTDVMSGILQFAKLGSSFISSSICS